MRPATMAISVEGMISPEYTLTQRPLRMTRSAGSRPMHTSISFGAVSLQGLTVIFSFPPKSARSGSRLGEKPLVIFLIVEFPAAFWSGHNVEIIEVIAVQRRARMIALGHQRHVSVFNGDRFIERSVFGVDALECEPLLWVDAMIIDFLEQRFMGKIVLIMLVRRIGRAIAAGRNHLDHQQIFRRFPLWQDIGDMSYVAAFASRFLAELVGPDEPSRQSALSRC